MNRQIFYSWIKDFVNLRASVETFEAEFSAKSQTVERIIPFKPCVKGVIAAKITAIEPHPDADRLRLATVDTGSKTVTVVCGAPNIAVGQIVPFAPVGAELCDPDSDGQTFTLKKAKIRGVESAGMLCAADEMGIGSDHGGIILLPQSTKLGTSIDKMLPKEDQIFDIEITTNRPDAMSVYGLAQEAAAVFENSMKQVAPQPDMTRQTEKSLSVEVQESKLCPRYQAVVVDNVQVGPSPLWLQVRLMAAGMKPINNVVDITNYVLLEYGQPLHAFDYDKLNGHKLTIRTAKPREKITALDEQSYSLTSGDLVIADANGPVAIAGVMGGLDSSVTAETTTIVFESANFNPLNVRRTARRLNLYSESSSLFEKGLPREGTFPGILRALELVQQIGQGKTASPIIDIYHSPYREQVITFEISELPRYLEIELSPAKVKSILESLGFRVSGSQTMKVTVPWWREHDVKESHDLVEEVARIYGYNNLPSHLPMGALPLVQRSPLLQLEKELRHLMAGCGFTEVYHYSLTSPKVFEQAGMTLDNAVALHNPLSEDLTHMRTSLLPQLLQTIEDNKGVRDQQYIFELSNVYLLKNAKQLPIESSRLSAGIYGVGEPFRHAKGIVERIMQTVGIAVESKVIDDDPVWQPGEAVELMSGKTVIGRYGIVRKTITDAIGLSQPVAVLDINVEALTTVEKTSVAYQPIPEFPAVERDITVTLNQSVQWAEIEENLVELDPLLQEVVFIDTYTGPGVESGQKRITLRCVFRSNDRTLTSEEVDAILTKAITTIQDQWRGIIK